MLIKNTSTANNIHLKNNHNNYFTNNNKFPLNNNDNDFSMGLPLSNTTKTITNKTEKNPVKNYSI